MNTSKLTYPQLDLPASVETVAYRQIIKVLKTDPLFGPIVNTWVIWDGSIHDTTDPTYAYCPYCRISPFPTESSWITEVQHAAPLTLRVTLAVAGTNWDQIANFWGAMRAAIFPQDNPTRRAFVTDQINNIGKVTRPTLQVAAFGQNTEESGAKFMVADGTIKFGLLIKT